VGGVGGFIGRMIDISVAVDLAGGDVGGAQQGDGKVGKFHADGVLLVVKGGRGAVALEAFGVGVNAGLVVGKVLGYVVVDSSRGFAARRREI